ncbi:MAG: DUF3800 domain-containing protein [Firmicutes bacterium]|nr:DUF3800 domain-containing protein [Bacillota bacterium]
MKYLTVYCDESSKEGQFYGNFYGGAVVCGNLNKIIKSLNQKKIEVGFGGEIKWQKVSAQYLDKYIQIMDHFFGFVQKNEIKIRVMFTQNRNRAVNLTTEQQEKAFFLLYYQFFKHAFGFKHCNTTPRPIGLKVFFDQLPDTNQKNKEFKEFIQRLQFGEDFRKSNILIRIEDIAEAISHNHVILQCMDIVLGAIHFRLNNLHKVKPQDSWKRGNRTIAKEKLYKFINQKIREIYPNFNIGISTGIREPQDTWNHPYRHWLFIPTDHVIDNSCKKPK